MISIQQLLQISLEIRQAMKKNNEMATLAQRQYGTLVSDRTSSSFHQKKLQRKRSGNSTSQSRQIRFSKRDTNRNDSPSQYRFIRNKYIKRQELLKSQIDPHIQTKIKNNDIQRSAEKSDKQSFEFELKINNHTYLAQNSLQKLNQKNRFSRSKSYKLKQNQQSFQKQYNQLQKSYNKIKQQLKQSNLLNQKQKSIIKQLEIKANDLTKQLQQNEKVVLQKLQEIQLLNSRCFSKSKIQQANQFLKVDPIIKNISSFSFIIDNVEKGNDQYFTENNQKSQSNICDVSQQMENMKIIANLNEKIKYQEVEIAMLKRVIERFKDQSEKKDREIRVLSQRIKTMSAKLELKAQTSNKNRNSKNQEDEPSLTFEISIDSNSLIS